MGNCASTGNKHSKSSQSTLNIPSNANSNQDQANELRAAFRKQRSSRVNPHTLRDQLEDADMLEIPGATLVTQPQSKKVSNQLFKALRKYVLFDKLSQDTVERLAKHMSLYTVPAGTEVFHQGHSGLSMFVLLKGAAEYVVDGTRVTTLILHSVFGGDALFENTFRTSTVNCTKTSTVARLKRGDYLQIVESLSVQNYQECKRFIGSVPFFAALTETQQESLLELLMLKKFKHGQVILHEGSTGDLFYIIKQGQVRCTVQQKEVRRLGPGEFFGEQALLYDSPRTATISACGNVEVLALRRAPLAKALGDKLLSVIYKNSLRMAFEHSPVLSLLTRAQVEQVIAHMEVQTYAEQTIVIPDSEPVGEHLWVVLKGRLRSPSAKVHKCQCIGDISLLGAESGEEFESFYAEKEADVAGISKNQIETLLGNTLEAVTSLNKRVYALAQVKLLQGLPREELVAVAEQLKTRRFPAETEIFAEGSAGAEVFLIKSGRVGVTRDGKLIRTLESGNYFGERAIIFKEARTATVTAIDPTTCWVLRQDQFLKISESYDQLSKRLLLQDDTVSLADLQVVRKLGSGAYGNVFLVANRRNQSAYALKTIAREKVRAHGLYENLLTERDVLIHLDHPMIMKLVKTFKDSQRIYFLLEYVPGTPFLNVVRRRLDLQAARFYTGCLLLVLEHLHSKNIVYRDLKPENIVLDETGYPKVLDFGACRVIAGRTFTTIGTPHYMAPEVISGLGYSFSADLWSLGVMLFEFITGQLPFGEDACSPHQVYENVLKGEYEFPAHTVRGECMTLVEQLLDQFPTMRGTTEQIKEHALFKPLNWNKLLVKSIFAPQVPRVKNFKLDLEVALRRKYDLFTMLAAAEEEQTNKTWAAAVAPPTSSWDEVF